VAQRFSAAITALFSEAASQFAEKLAFWVAQRFQCVRENSIFQLAVEQSLRLSAAKRRKSAAHSVIARGKVRDSYQGIALAMP
jgi:hypothetical protein